MLKSIQLSSVNRDGLSKRKKRFCLFLYRDVTDNNDNSLMFYVIFQPNEKMFCLFRSGLVLKFLSECAAHSFRIIDCIDPFKGSFHEESNFP